MKRLNKVVSHKLTAIAQSHPLFHMTPALGESRNGAGTCRIVVNIWSDPDGQVYVEWRRPQDRLHTRILRLASWLSWMEAGGDGRQQGMHQQELEGE